MFTRHATRLNVSTMPDLQEPEQRCPLVSKKAGETSVKEIAKAVTDVTNLARDLGSFFEKILGPGLAHLGGSFADWASVYRYQNSLRLADKVERIHRERGITETIAIPPRLALPLLQQSSQEDDDYLQNMWAALIANATDPAQKIQASRVFVGLIADLEPIDALVLFAIHADEVANPHRHRLLGTDLSDEEYAEKKRNIFWLSKTVDHDMESLNISLETLGRLGLVNDEIAHDSANSVTFVPLTHPQAELALTFTGRALLRACT